MRLRILSDHYSFISKRFRVARDLLSSRSEIQNAMTIPLYRRTRENYRHGSRDLLSYSVEFVGRRQRNFEYGKTTTRLCNRLVWRELRRDNADHSARMRRELVCSLCCLGYPLLKSHSLGSVSTICFFAFIHGYGAEDKFRPSFSRRM